MKRRQVCVLGLRLQTTDEEGNTDHLGVLLVRGAVVVPCVPHIAIAQLPDGGHHGVRVPDVHHDVIGAVERPDRHAAQMRRPRPFLTTPRGAWSPGLSQRTLESRKELLAG